MNKTSTILLLLCIGCGHADVQKGLDQAQQKLVLVDLGAEQSKNIIEEATKLQMERCREAEDREACMGALGHPVAPAYEKLGQAYDAAVTAIEALGAAWSELQPAYEQARKVLGR